MFASPLHTARLVLRIPTEADVDDVHSYQSREDVCRYLPFGPRTREEVAERIGMWTVATTLAAEGDYWQIVSTLGTRVIGDTYFKLRTLEHEGAEIGWSLHPDFAGRGYASEAARAILRIAFEEVGLHRVMAQLDPRNVASIAMCERLGMRSEAYFVKDYWFKGEWGDTGIYGILREEWLAAAAQDGQPPPAS